MLKQYNTWVSIPLRPDGSCCLGSHFYRTPEKGESAKPDYAVCPRERAWREYVRARDAYESCLAFEAKGGSDANDKRH